MDRTGMDTERCVIGELLALKDAPDDELLESVGKVPSSIKPPRS
jgi:hypothetical protein